MVQNYFKIAWRNLIRNKGYSLINIGGLAVGMAVAITIGLWIYDETSFNKYHKNYGHIASVMEKSTFNGESNTNNALPRPLEFVMRNKYGDNFKHIVMSFWPGERILSVDDKKVSINGRFMQSPAPEMLSLQMTKGTWNSLQDPSSVILSSSAAKALFGDDDPMNRTVTIDTRMNAKVTGVYEDLPSNTEFNDLHFVAAWDLFVAANDWVKDAKDFWGNNSFLMYVELQPGTDFKSVSSKIKNAKQDNIDAEEKKFNREIFLNPMSQWHLYSEWKNGVNVGGRIQFVWLFGIIGIFVLLLACINFMNLSTARSEKRAKEVGIRKAVGSMRGQLISQFLSESFIVVLVSFTISLALVAILLPWFNTISGKDMTMPVTSSWFWVSSLGFIITTSLLSGSYPALFLSSFNPVKVLKGTFKAGRFSTVPRKILVVIQFTVSIALITGTIIVYRQIQHAKDRPVGYNRNGLLMTPMNSSDFAGKFDLLRNDLMNSGTAIEISQSSNPVTEIWANNGGIKWRDKDPNKEDGFATVFITPEFGKTVGWQFKDGRDFSKQFASDSIGKWNDSSAIYNIVVNEAAVKYMALKNPVGEILTWNKQPLKIIGVIKDMIMESPYDPVRQTIYLVSYRLASNSINIKINPALNSHDALSKIESSFKKLVPSAPFNYKFADTEFGLKFKAEERLGDLATVFAILAIFISCLGLLGLASFVAEKRTKEIGVRKVLGASVFSLWRMLSKDFVLLITIACAIAIPVAWYILSQWLQKYEYRTTISWWIFAVAVSGALIITLLTVSFQAIKAAIANPVKSLRTE